MRKTPGWEESSHSAALDFGEMSFIRHPHDNHRA